MDFNDIRTTLQALIAIYDNANSLHTNAFDEAVTTPGEESVRRALAIQMIINREWGLAMNENPLQGSYVIDELTDLVEAAVLAEFDRISSAAACSARWRPATSAAGSRTSRCSTSTASTTARCRSSASTRSAGPDAEDGTPDHVELARATEEEKASQLRRVREFQAVHASEAEAALARLKEAAASGDNVFAVLMDAARVCTLGQVTEAFFEVGGQYRRNV